MSAYQRWEIHSLEENAGPLSHHKEDHLHHAPSSSIAHQEGFAKGREEGYQAGLKAGQIEAQQRLQSELAVVSTIVAQFKTNVGQLEHTVAQDVLNLSLEIAKAMLGNALEVRHELIIPIVRKAIGQLPGTAKSAQIVLHPDDAVLVNQAIGQELNSAGWSVLADAKLQRGDCRLETQSNQIDGTQATRWQCLVDAFGDSPAWLVSAT